MLPLEDSYILDKCDKGFFLSEEDWAMSGLQSRDLQLEQPHLLLLCYIWLCASYSACW